MELESCLTVPGRDSHRIDKGKLFIEERLQAVSDRIEGMENVENASVREKRILRRIESRAVAHRHENSDGTAQGKQISHWKLENALFFSDRHRHRVESQHSRMEMLNSNGTVQWFATNRRR